MKDLDCGKQEKVENSDSIFGVTISARFLVEKKREKISAPAFAPWW
jgi:hypothetical protein